MNPAPYPLFTLNKMKLNVMFTIAAAVLILLGLTSLLAPAAVMLGTTDLTAAAVAKQSASIELALGVMAWLLSNAEPSKTRNGVVLGYTLVFAFWSASCIYGAFLVGASSSAKAGFEAAAVIHGLVAIGFFVSGRASMQIRFISPREKRRLYFCTAQTPLPSPQMGRSFLLIKYILTWKSTTPSARKEVKSMPSPAGRGTYRDADQSRQSG